MEITQQQREQYLEMCVEGRLDGYWAQHLASSVGAVMREGAHAVRLNLARTSYISSAGIGVLVELYKSFQAVNGSFAVVEASAPVAKVLEMVGLAQMLTTGEPLAGAVAGAVVQQARRIEAGGAVFEVHEVQAGAAMACRVTGRPEALAGLGFEERQQRSVAVAEDGFSLGLGAFGDQFENTRERFGEYVAVAGAAACQPTDGANFPDYMLSSGSFVPRVSTLYAVGCEGGFGKVVSFESASGRDPVALSLILETCREAAGAKSAAVVMLAESAGLMGAMLKRSPGAATGAGVRTADRLFAYPEIRRWISFSPERAFTHALALVAGVVSVDAPADLAPFLRPVARGSQLIGHCHAAAFAYRPLQKGRVELGPAVRALFEAGGLQAVLHLLADDREIAGGGESELLRGTCWVSPIESVRREGGAE